MRPPSVPLLVLPLLLSVPPSALAQAPDKAGSAPQEVVSTLLRSGCRGLPVGPEWEKLKPLFSADFALTIRRAQEVQARSIREFPDEKPPWIEGDFFSSLFEGPTSFSVGNPAVDGAETLARVPVAMEHAAADGSVTRWTDTIILVREGGGWKVDDLVFGGTWDFAAQGSLKGSLQESLETDP